MAQERRLMFGQVAELYERMRPSYPEALVEDVIGLSGVGRSGRALEVGAGTGKATRLLAEEGVPIVALEPNAQMAAVARRVCGAYDQVEIEECEFEHFDGAQGSFQLVFSAQAWHWISHELRYAKSRALLAPGGLLAVFWNDARWEESGLQEELEEVYRREAPEFDPATNAGPMHPASRLTPMLWGDWESEIAAAGGFDHAEIRRYRWSTSYSAHEYQELLRTHSDHMIRPEPEREALLAGVGEVIERHGGTLELPYMTLLCLARAT